MRIFYGLSSYISHRTAGQDYIDCLRSLGHTIVTGPEELPGSDLAILHNEPTNFPFLFETMPALQNIPVIGYCVWEGNILPEAFLPGLRMVDEIWTCSAYSRESFARHFEEVFVVPHVVKRLKTGQAALKETKSLLGECAPDDFLFFSIVDAANPRKNIQTLVKAFTKARQLSRRKIRLILKQYRLPMDFSLIPGVHSITGDLPAEVIHALHMLCHAYVSAHHVEGWGLGLSGSMAYGKPVIATGYSGNMEFMDENNSYPVGFSLGPVSSEMCGTVPLFTPEMIWANINENELVDVMVSVADKGAAPEKTANARQISEKFGSEAVAGIIKQLLERRQQDTRGDNAGRFQP